MNASTEVTGMAVPSDREECGAFSLPALCRWFEEQAASVITHVQSGAFEAAAHVFGGMCGARAMICASVCGLPPGSREGMMVEIDRALACAHTAIERVGGHIHT